MAKAKVKGEKGGKTTPTPTPTTKGGKEAKKAPVKVGSQRKKVEDLVAKMNKALKGDGKIVTGVDVDDLDFRMERTGNPAYDYVTNGGLIRGGASCVWGADRSGKTSLTAHVIRHFQSKGYACALAAIEGFDKAWWRRIGVYMPYSSREIDLLRTRPEKERAAKYNAYYEKQGWIPLTLLIHKNGLRALDFVVAASRTNAFDLIAVDSLGAIVGNDEAENKSIADAKYGGNSIPLGVFANFITSTFNYHYDEEGKYSPTGEVDNQTIVLGLNQARSTIGTMARAEHKILHPPGGFGIRHLWNQAVFHHGADEEHDTVRYENRTIRDVHTRTFRLTGTKMRGGPEQRQAEIDLTLKTPEACALGRKPGEIDVWKCLRSVSILVGALETRGTRFLFKGGSWNGREAMELALRNDAGLYEELYTDMIEKAKEDALTGSVPEVPG